MKAKRAFRIFKLSLRALTRNKMRTFHFYFFQLS